MTNTKENVENSMILETKEEALAIASDTNSSASVLRQLAGFGDLQVRQAVAQNPSTPLDVLFFLRHDAPVIRETLVTNPASPASLLERLSQDAHACVREFVSKFIGEQSMVLAIA